MDVVHTAVARSPRRRPVFARNPEETDQVDHHDGRTAREVREIVTLSTWKVESSGRVLWKGAR